MAATIPENQQVIFVIDGMTCAACVMHVENAFKEIPGVSAASVNLATEKALVEFDPETAQVDDENHRFFMLGALGCKEFSCEICLSGKTSKVVQLPRSF